MYYVGTYLKLLLSSNFRETLKISKTKRLPFIVLVGETELSYDFLFHFSVRLFEVIKVKGEMKKKKIMGLSAFSHGC